MILRGKFRVAFGVTEQEVGDVIASERSVKIEGALRCAKQILDFLVKGPTTTKFELVSAMRPRNVVADLVVIGLILPRPASDLKLGTGAEGQVNIWDAVQVVRS